MKLTALILALATASSYSFTFNMSTVFGGDASLENATAYLVASTTTGGSFSTGSTFNLATDFDLGDTFGDFQVISSSFASSIIGISPNDWGLNRPSTPNIDTEAAGLSTGLDTGDRLGIIWHDADDNNVYGFTGLSTADTSNTSTSGWTLPSAGASVTLVDVYDSYTLAAPGRIDAADIVTLGSTVPEPSMTFLGLLGLSFIGMKRKR